MTGFGLAHLKTEGCHIHPDDPNHGYWGDDEGVYLKQLLGYIRDNGLDLIKEVQACSKPHLLRAAVEQAQQQAWGFAEVING